MSAHSPRLAKVSIEETDELVGTLSPSRAGDFLTCPLLYRLRHIDRIPERPSLDAARGTVVHRSLELLFGEPAAERTAERARAFLPQAWAEVAEAEPVRDALAAEEIDEADWLATCESSLAKYFDLEDPRRLEPQETELFVEAVTPGRLGLRGIIDRLDVAADGRVRIVDYKTGRAPGVGFEARALFQMRFYALVVLRSRGVLPAALQLMYLGSGEIISESPDEQTLLATERKVEAVWEAISTARDSGQWEPRPGRMCSWCSHKPLCPAYGGTPPPLPSDDRVQTDAASDADTGEIAPEAISST